MSRTPLLLALLTLLMPAPALVAGSPQGPSGQLVQDPVPALQDEVRRLEREVARDKSLTEELDVARARLAAAQGRIGEARAAWQKVIATRVARLDVLLSGRLDCDPSDIALYRLALAEARCGLAEVERDRAALARELPKVIAYYEAMLKMYDKLREAKAYEPDETEVERSIRKELRQARRRLDAVKRR
jgi:hypothetical protein